MKKVLAIILSIAMLFGVLTINTFADATPTVTLVTNAGSPIAEGTHTHITVKFENFSTIKGMDVTISAEHTTLGEVYATGFKELVNNENFVEVNDDNEDIHTIRVVDLTGGANTGKIVFDVTAPAEDALVTVEGKYADSGKTLFNITTDPNTLEVKKEIVSVPVEIPQGTTPTEEEPYELPQPEEATQKFIPYGSVYKEVNGEIVYAEKNDDGSFNITDTDFKVDSFDVPANGITTFGVSENTTDSSVLRFGSYSKINKSAKFNGTMVFEGDWVALKNYYIKNGYSVQQLLDLIYKHFDATLDGKEGKTYVYYDVPTDEGTERINVYKFKQNKHMWKDDANGILEYALRLSNAKNNTTYTAVAYSETEAGDITISADVKSETKLAKAN
ncbi:MAG: hypothetical protein E7537_05655 [Ruminococcaceae bacterium]|nr:hypothetical protein [Oscillospiraceae bacterium]